MLEKKIQTAQIKQLKKNGWKKVLKFETPSEDGNPDLIALGNNKSIAFVESKATGKKPTELQLHRHKELREMGFTVIVADSVNEEIKNLNPI